ncbi:MAG: hypothetical protein FGM33_09370 [Candidatus Kapabacteria bacterium]|nr:hypothetical protein [Candidatus Kapabacteria bacterium]
MFRPFALILMTFLSIVGAVAQDDRLNELNFDEEPLPEETVAYSSVGIGPVFSLFTPDMTDVNAKATAMGIDELSSPFIFAGAEVFAAIGIVPNLRFGFSWLSGSVGSVKDFISTGGGTKRSLDYAISMRSLHIDYAIVPVSKLAIIPGVGLTWGYSTITQSTTTGSFDWVSDTSMTSQVFLEQSSLCLQPRLSLEYAVTPFLNLRAQAGYTVPVSTSDWTANVHATAQNVPSSIGINGVSAQIGVFVGLFN